MKRIFFLIFIGCLLISFKSSAQSIDSIPAHHSFKIISKIIGEERTINIWTPPNYENNTDSLSVIYMLDGGIKEDFPHIANTIASLVAQKRIPPVILVGIENTQRRRDLSGPTSIEADKRIAPEIGGAENFRNFIGEELFLEINQRYRTSAVKTIIGESLAGLFIIETLFLKPTMFDNYIAMDPSLWWNQHYLVRTAKDHLGKLPEKTFKLWFAGSKTKDIGPYTRDLAKILTLENFKQLNWKYSDEPKELHNTIFRAAKEKALIWIFNP
jgi:hypothetical protein